jgi:ribosomal protein S27E
MDAMSLRDRLRAAGLLDETPHEGMRFVSATCPDCGRAQHWAMPVGKLARCIVCGTVLPGQVGTA